MTDLIPLVEEQDIPTASALIAPQIPAASRKQGRKMKGMAESPMSAQSSGQEQPMRKKYRAGSKQDRVFQMLKSGTTIAQIMHATGWKEPSARGILYRVFRKEMGLELVSEINEYQERVYKILC